MNNRIELGEFRKERIRSNAERKTVDFIIEGKILLIASLQQRDVLGEDSRSHINVLQLEIEYIRENEAELRAIYAAHHPVVAPVVEQPQPEELRAINNQTTLEELNRWKIGYLNENRLINKIKYHAESDTVERLIRIYTSKLDDEQNILAGLVEWSNNNPGVFRLPDLDLPDLRVVILSAEIRAEKFNFYLAYMNRHKEDLRAIYAAHHPAVAPVERAVVVDNRKPQTNAEWLARCGFPEELIPEKYLCPISMQIMYQAVLLPPTKEYFSLESVRGCKGKHPLTREFFNEEKIREGTKLAHKFSLEIYKWVSDVIALKRDITKQKGLKQFNPSFEEWKEIADTVSSRISQAQNQSASSMSHIGPRDNRSRSASPVSGASSSSSAASNDSEFKNDSPSNTHRFGRK